MRTLHLSLLLAALVVSTGCAGRTPNPVLTPPAQLASANGRALDALNLVRDSALIFTNDAGTGQLPVPIARRVVQVHQNGVKLMDARGDNFVRIIQASLVAVLDVLPDPLKRMLGPYFFLANTLLDVLSNREIDLQLSADTIAAYQRARDASLQFDAEWLSRH